MESAYVCNYKNVDYLVIICPNFILHFKNIGITTLNNLFENRGQVDKMDDTKIIHTIYVYSFYNKNSIFQFIIENISTAINIDYIDLKDNHQSRLLMDHNLFYFFCNNVCYKDVSDLVNYTKRSEAIDILNDKNLHYNHYDSAFNDMTQKIKSNIIDKMISKNDQINDEFNKLLSHVYEDDDNKYNIKIDIFNGLDDILDILTEINTHLNYKHGGKGFIKAKDSFDEAINYGNDM